jgi:hypothetical protein
MISGFLAGPSYFTATGLVTTIIIAVAGFRTFGKWRREKLEEKRIEIAIEALALCYEARFIFENIRSPLSYPGEWDDIREKRPNHFPVRLISNSKR